MLSMTVRSYLREPRRPVVFMPVYFGYERIVEGRTYIGELSGRPKEKESVLGVIKSLPISVFAQQIRHGARQPGRAHRRSTNCWRGTTRAGAMGPGRCRPEDERLAARMDRRGDLTISPLRIASAASMPPQP